MQIYFENCNVTWFARDSSGNTEGGTKLVDADGEDIKSARGSYPSTLTCT